MQNADVKELGPALESLISSTGRSSTGRARTGRQQPTQPGVPGEVQAFAREVRISAYEPTNALLITASPQDWQILQRVLTKIDVPERQVYVEVLIMEVTVTDDVTVGVDLAALSEEDFVAASTFGDLANFLIQGPLGFTGGVVGVLDGEVDVTNPLTGQTMTVPRIPVLLTAIQTVTDLDVLSAPGLLTTDNKESKIHVGKNIPVVRGTARPLSQAVGESVAPTLYSQVGREDIGVKLTVTPQVSLAGEYVKLEIAVEVSDTIQSQVGIDPNISGPTLRKTLIQDTVIIRDGYMAIIGGLMSQSMDRSRAQIPILGDIPLLGFFFGKRGRVQEKRNLVVIITPHIVKSGDDLDELTARYRDEYDVQRVEMREDMNFWRRVFKKEKRTERTTRTGRTGRAKGVQADRVLGRKFNW